MPTTPTLADVIWSALKADRDEFYTSTVGIVQTYNPLTDTVDVMLPVLQPVNVEGTVEYEQHPVIPNVPIAWPQGGDYIMTFPLPPGTEIMVMFTHNSIAMWRETGARQIPPGELGRHKLGSAVAYPGIRPTTRPLSPSPTHVAARVAGVYLGKEGEDQVIEVTSAGVGLGHLAVEPVALAPVLMAFVTATGAFIAAVGPLVGTPAIALPLAPPVMAAIGAAVTAVAAATANVAQIPATLVKGK